MTVTELLLLPGQFFSHSHMEPYQEEDQVDHYMLLLILCNYHFFLSSIENLRDHSGSNRA
jgi:hypothetical protein